MVFSGSESLSKEFLLSVRFTSHCAYLEIQSEFKLPSAQTQASDFTHHYASGGLNCRLGDAGLLKRSAIPGVGFTDVAMGGRYPAAGPGAVARPGARPRGNTCLYGSASAHRRFIAKGPAEQVSGCLLLLWG
jgi:hypothetical protein